MHISRPLYEGLPWLYVVLGLAALAASYLLESSWLLSLTIGLGGLAALLCGVVVLLRRRDFRELEARYGSGRARESDLEARSDTPDDQH